MPLLDLGHTGNKYQIDDTQARMVVDAIRAGRRVELEILETFGSLSLFISPTSHVAIRYPK